MEHHNRWSEVVAASCAVWFGMTACSGSTNETTGSEAGRAGAASAHAGASAAGAGGASHGGAGAAGASQSGAGGGGISTAGTGGSQAGASSGGAMPIAGAGAGGGPETGDGGSPGITDTRCTLESLHLKVMGGAAFERSAQPQDTCGGEMTEDKRLLLTFFVRPPELENTLLVSAIGEGIEPGSKGPFTPALFSFLTTGAIWDIRLPDAEHPLACTANLTTFEMVPPNRWRVAGSLSCPSALSGIGDVGATPLTINDFKFSILFDAPP